jgi:hypothetical protein
MAISRMQEPRQLYGLGSLVKKAVRGVKKLVKSPLGKAALIGGLGYGLGGGFSGAGFNRGTLFSRLGLGSIGDVPGGGTAFQPNKFGSFLGSMIPGTAGFKGKNLAIGLGGLAVATPFIQKALKTWVLTKK